MVMRVARKLEPWVLARKQYLFNGAFVYHCFDVAVDRRDTQTGDMYASELKHLLCEQGSSGLFNRVANRCALPGGAFCFRGVNGMHTVSYLH
jgi:hypothetical protein